LAFYLLDNGEMVTWLLPGGGPAGGVGASEEDGLEMRVTCVAEDLVQAFATPDAQAQLARLPDNAQGREIKRRCARYPALWARRAGPQVVEAVAQDCLWILRKGLQCGALWVRTLRQVLLGTLGPSLMRMAARGEGGEEGAGPVGEILVVAHRALHLLPWSALFAGERDTDGGSAGHGLGQWRLRMSPSLELLALLRRRGAAQRAAGGRGQGQMTHDGDGAANEGGGGASRGERCLVVGNPCPLALRAHLKFEELPSAEAEARRVAAMLRASGKEVMELSTQAATKEAVLRHVEGCAWVHLACHAHPGVDVRLFLPPHRRPVDSLATRQALFLSTSDCVMVADGYGGETEADPVHGLLTVDEVVGLNLAPGCVVVLSACSTATGAVNGEGVVGLARAFMLAGAASVVCTLWEVRDVSQQLLMEHFYARVCRGVGLAAALYESQLFVQRLTQAELDSLHDEEARCASDWVVLFLLRGEGRCRDCSVYASDVTLDA